MLSLSQIQHFSLIDLIKSGSYSTVYKAKDHKSVQYAIKLLPIALKKPKPKGFLSIFKRNKPLLKEGKILALLQGIRGIPRLFFYGENPDIKANMIVTELLGKDLGDLSHEKMGFTTEFISTIGCRLIEILEEVHGRGVIHRDLKPENILMSVESKNDVILTDFGLSKLEKKKKNKMKAIRRQFVGNLKFASMNAHFGDKISQKDDLESLGYVLLNFWQGNLPWERIQSKDLNEKIQRIGLRKKEFSKNELTALPKGFKEYFSYLMELKKEEKIDYKLLKTLILSLNCPTKKEEEDRNGEKKYIKKKMRLKIKTRMKKKNQVQMKIKSP